jgi:hypothetical protein
VLLQDTDWSRSSERIEKYTLCRFVTAILRDCGLLVILANSSLEVITSFNCIPSRGFKIHPFLQDSQGQ